MSLHVEDCCCSFRMCKPILGLYIKDLSAPWVYFNMARFCIWAVWVVVCVTNPCSVQKRKAEWITVYWHCDLAISGNYVQGSKLNLIETIHLHYQTNQKASCSNQILHNNVIRRKKASIHNKHCPSRAPGSNHSHG